MDKSKKKKTKIDLFAGRRINETIELLRQSDNPILRDAVAHIGDIDWPTIHKHLYDFAPEEIMLLGKLSGLVRLSQDLYSIGQTPIIIMDDGTIVSNPWEIPIYRTSSLEEAQHILKTMGEQP